MPFDALIPLDLPPRVSVALEALRASLRSHAGQELRALILYGSVARKRYRPNASDVNVAIVLRSTSPATLDAIAPALRAAFRAIRLEPFIVAEHEVATIADLFPAKVLELREHQVLLYGENPFASAKVAPAHLRLRAQMELTNLAMRLRRRYVGTSDDAAGLFSALSDIATPLSVELGVLLRVAGEAAVADDAPAAVFAAASKRFGLEAEPLAQLAALKAGEPMENEPPVLFAKILGVVSAAAALARTVEVRDEST